MKVEDISLYLQAHPELLEYRASIAAQVSGQKAELVSLRIERNGKTKLVLVLDTEAQFCSYECADNATRVTDARGRARELRELSHEEGSMNAAAVACIEKLCEALDFESE
jgi:hypothetical protein